MIQEERRCPAWPAGLINVTLLVVSVAISTPRKWTDGNLVNQIHSTGKIKMKTSRQFQKVSTKMTQSIFLYSNYWIKSYQIHSKFIFQPQALNMQEISQTDSLQIFPTRQTWGISFWSGLILAKRRSRWWNPRCMAKSLTANRVMKEVLSFFWPSCQEQRESLRWHHQKSFLWQICQFLYWCKSRVCCQQGQEKNEKTNKR
jgi:hypothetical protein